MSNQIMREVGPFDSEEWDDSVLSFLGQETVENNARDTVHESKRSIRLGKRKEEHGELGADEKPKGVVRYDDFGRLVHWNEDELEWDRAVYHNDIREELIDAANLLGRYDHPREKGKSALDSTSFFPLHQTWGPRRENRPELLFRFYKPSEEDLPTPSYDVGLWYHGPANLLVLDADNNPVRKWANIPDVLSSKVEGWLMEQLCREDPRITLIDLLARLPHKDTAVDESPAPMVGRNALSMRMSRFRAQSALFSWLSRAGSDNVRKYLEGLIDDEYLEANDLRGFRDLTTQEIKEMTKGTGNLGQFPEKAGKGANAKRQTTESSSSNGQSQEAKDTRAKQTTNQTAEASTKRKRTVAVEEEWQDNHLQPDGQSQKRARLDIHQNLVQKTLPASSRDQMGSEANHQPGKKRNLDALVDTVQPYVPTKPQCTIHQAIAQNNQVGPPHHAEASQKRKQIASNYNAIHDHQVVQSATSVYCPIYAENLASSSAAETYWPIASQSHSSNRCGSDLRTSDYGKSVQPPQSGLLTLPVVSDPIEANVARNLRSKNAKSTSNDGWTPDNQAACDFLDLNQPVFATQPRRISSSHVPVGPRKTGGKVVALFGHPWSPTDWTADDSVSRGPTPITARAGTVSAPVDSNSARNTGGEARSASKKYAPSSNGTASYSPDHEQAAIVTQAGSQEYGTTDRRLLEGPRSPSVELSLYDAHILFGDSLLDPEYFAKAYSHMTDAANTNHQKY